MSAKLWSVLGLSRINSPLLWVRMRILSSITGTAGGLDMPAGGTVDFTSVGTLVSRSREVYDLCVP